MKKLKKDLQAVTKEFKILTKKTKELSNKLAKTAFAELERAQAAIKLKPPTQHAAKALKALAKQTEKLIKAVDKFEKGKATRKQKAKAKAKARPAKKVPAKKAGAKKATGPTATDQVLRIIKRSKKGVDVPTLMKKTGLADKQIRNIVFKASKQGKIKKAGRGVYVAA